MNMIRNHLISLGAVSVLLLGVALAQDQAPQPPAPAAAADPNAAARGLFGTRRTLPTVRKPPTPGAAVEESAASSGPLEPTLDKSMLKNKSTMPGLKYKKNPIEIVLMDYALVTGKTLLTSPGVQPLLKTEISLESQEGEPLTREEYLDAIETVLSMNGIVLEPFGEKFIKVLPLKTVRTDGIRIQMDAPEGGYPEKSQVVSQMIQLKAIAVSEAQKAIEGFKRPDGMIQTFERTNSLLVTDTQENVNRMIEIIKFIDQPLVATEEVNVRMIRFAKADDIKKRLEEIVAESQKQNQAKEEIKANTSGSPGFSRTTSATSPLTGRPLPPGLSRLTAAAAQQPAPATPNEILETLVSDADRGMIRGKVQIIADERSNQLIIITRKENMDFFERIISVLDIETSPDVKVEVQRLEFADAEEVSTMLNDLIGNATSKKDDAAPAGAPKGAADTPSRSTTLAEAVAARASRSSSSSSSAAADGKSKLGQLSKDNIKILADKRTNAIVMMGSPSDLAAIKEIVKNMDIQLSQVLIETVVLQVDLGDDLKTGMDWVQRGKHTSYVNDESKPIYDTDGTTLLGYQQKRVVTRDTIFNNGDQLGGGGGSGSSLLGGLLNLGATVASNATDTASGILGARTGISYFLKSDKLNIAALIEASKSDTRTKVLSSPVLMTVDNKEATLEATSMRYLYKGVRYSGSTQYGTEVPDFEQRDIGLTVKITPRISPNGGVLLTIEETFETVGANQQVGKEDYPTVNTRKVQADVSVENMQTVVLGGLVQNEIKTEEIGIPILKDIPYIGKYLFGKTSFADSRSELLIFLTPYVLDNPKDLEAEAVRRKASLSDDQPWIDYGWSKSKLADPVPSAERTRRTKQRWATEDTNYKADKEYDKLLKAREDQLEKRTKEEAEEDLRQAEKDAKMSSAKEQEDDGATEVKLRAVLSEMQAKKRARQTAAEQAPVSEVPTVISVSETVEVLGPKGGGQDGGPVENEQGGQSDADEPKKAWWRLW